MAKQSKVHDIAKCPACWKRRGDCAAGKRQRAAIGDSYARQSAGRQIDILKIGPMYRAIEARLVAGEDLDAAVAAEIPRWTVAAGEGDQGMTMECV